MKQAQALDTVKKDIDTAVATRVITSEEGRTFAAIILRLIETLRDGEPKTQMPARHHQ
jgi:hypothetical protein